MARTSWANQSGRSQPNVIWDGLDVLQGAFQKSAEFREEAEQILRDSAEAAQFEIVGAYPRKTGNLRRGVKIRKVKDSAGMAGVQLVNRAPHAHLYEYGTDARETKGKKTMAAGLSRGTMKGQPTFGPIAARHQRQAIILIVARLLEYGNVTSVDGDQEVIQSYSAGSRLL